jgi:hypothetical protein
LVKRRGKSENRTTIIEMTMGKKEKKKGTSQKRVVAAMEKRCSIVVLSPLPISGTSGGMPHAWTTTLAVVVRTLQELQLNHRDSPDRGVCGHRVVWVRGKWETGVPALSGLSDSD